MSSEGGELGLMKILIIVLFVLAAGVPISVTPAVAQEPLYHLEVKPTRCISLHQGQTCYQNLVLSWSTPAAGEYCLYQRQESEDPLPVVCWERNQRKTYKLEFVSDRNMIYELRRKGQDEILASVQVEVAWVYKSGPTNFNRWRLF